MNKGFICFYNNDKNSKRPRKSRIKLKKKEINLLERPKKIIFANEKR